MTQESTCCASEGIVAGSAFHEGLAASWSKGYASGSFKRRLEFMTGHLDRVVYPERFWLDAGCGSGVLSRELASRAATVLGVDASPAMVEQALSAPAPKSGAVRYELVRTVEQLPLDAASVDGVLCSSVLEYVDNTSMSLAEFHRVLKPGGVLLVSVPNALSAIRIVQRLCRLCGRLCGRSVFDYLSVSKHDYLRKTIVEEIERQGFRVEATASFAPYLSPILGPLGLGALWLVAARKQHER